MARVLIFDETNGKIKQYMQSAHTPDFENRADVLINPDVEGVNLKAAVVENGTVRNMTQVEIDEDKLQNYERYRRQEMPAPQQKLDALWDSIANADNTRLDEVKQLIADVEAKYPAPE